MIPRAPFGASPTWLAGSTLECLAAHAEAVAHRQPTAILRDRSGASEGCLFLAAVHETGERSVRLLQTAGVSLARVLVLESDPDQADLVVPVHQLLYTENEYEENPSMYWLDPASLPMLERASHNDPQTAAGRFELVIGHVQGALTRAQLAGEEDLPAERSRYLREALDALTAAQNTPGAPDSTAEIRAFQAAIDATSARADHRCATLREPSGDGERFVARLEATSRQSLELAWCVRRLAPSIRVHRDVVIDWNEWSPLYATVGSDTLFHPRTMISWHLQRAAVARNLGDERLAAEHHRVASDLLARLQNRETAIRLAVIDAEDR